MINVQWPAALSLKTFSARQSWDGQKQFMQTVEVDGAVKLLYATNFVNIKTVYPTRTII